MHLLRILAVLLVSLALLTSATAQPQRTTGASGLPLPRFASLASGEVNVRAGPGLEFPIRWLYSRPGLPVRILEEYDVWRLIEDPDGDQGWTHSSLLSTQRTMMVQAPGVQDVHRLANNNSRVVVRAEQGVIGELLNCDQAWCRVEISGRRGWLPRPAIWGVLDYEWRS